MKKSYFIVVLTLTCLLGAALTAHAQDSRSIVVNVPFEFVAGARVLPAGRYSVEPIFRDSGSALVIHGYDNSVFLLPIVFDGLFDGQANVRFEQVGNKHFLSKIQTPAGAYTIVTPRPMAKSVMVNGDGTLSPAGAN
jgi:hypothetical protein